MMPAQKRLIFAVGLLAAACGGNEEPADDLDLADTTGDETTVEVVQVAERELPPESGAARDVQFPEITRSTTTSGLTVNTVRFGQLPVVYLRLVIRTGSAADPEELPGLAHFAAEMLKEGTRTRSSAQLAEAVEFLGADMEVGDDQENVFVLVRALSDHLGDAMELLADVARNPRFSSAELRRLKARELDRLRLLSQQPQHLARRTLFRELYGEHPYARIDTTPAAIRRVSQADLRRWHRANAVPNNTFLVAVGNVDPAEVQRMAEEHFSGWRSRPVRDSAYADPPQRTAREVIVVDRPSSQQSTIFIGNLALARNDPSYVRLLVANQVLGGSAASRLFQDLRERRSLTYGAYSVVAQRPRIAPFVAYARVSNELTEQAVAGFMEHLDRIVAEEIPQEEIDHAERYLSDSFPLRIQTASRVSLMVEQLRVYELPDDYWNGFRSSIRGVTAAQAHEAAQTYIRPGQGLVVAVGQAASIVEPLRRYGPVRVIDTEGREISTFEALAAPETTRAEPTDTPPQPAAATEEPN